MPVLLLVQVSPEREHLVVDSSSLFCGGFLLLRVVGALLWTQLLAGAKVEVKVLQQLLPSKAPRVAAYLAGMRVDVGALAGSWFSGLFATLLSNEVRQGLHRLQHASWVWKLYAHKKARCGARSLNIMPPIPTLTQVSLLELKNISIVGT